MKSCFVPSRRGDNRALFGIVCASYRHLVSWKKLIPFPLLVLSIVLMGDFSVADDLDQVEKWKKYDKVYLGSISASGIRASVTPPILRRDTRTRRESYSWKMTQKNNDKCIQLYGISFDQPEKGRGPLPQRISFFEDAKRIVRRETTLDGSVPQNEFLTSDNVVNNTLHMLSPGSDVLSGHMDMFVFALGRGFSSRLGAIDDSSVAIIQHNDEKLYSLKASGHYLSSDGFWELQFLPSAAYMVRLAKFFRNETLALEIETYGMKAWGDGIFPEKAEVRVHITPEKCVVHQVTISEAKLEFDAGLYKLVQNDVDEKLKDGSTIIDETSGDTKVSLVGSPEEFELTPNPRSLRRILFIVGFNLLGIALLIYLIRRDR